MHAALHTYGSDGSTFTSEVTVSSMPQHETICLSLDISSMRPSPLGMRQSGYDKFDLFITTACENSAEQLVEQLEAAVGEIKAHLLQIRKDQIDAQVKRFDGELVVDIDPKMADEAAGRG